MKPRLTSFIKSLNSKLASLWNASEQGRELRKALNSSGESSVRKTIRLPHVKLLESNRNSPHDETVHF